MTSAKEELIYESKSLADKEILRIAEYAADLNEPVALTGGNIKDYVQGRIQKQIYIDGREIKRACKEGGLIAYDKRMAINGFPEIVVYNKAAHDRLVDVRNDDKEFRAGLRRYVRAIDRIVDQEI